MKSIRKYGGAARVAAAFGAAAYMARKGKSTVKPSTRLTRAGVKRVAKGKGRTRTTTRNKKKRNLQQVKRPDMGTGGESFSYAKYVGRPSKGTKYIKVLTQEFNNKETIAFYTSSNWGLQNSITIRGFLNGPELIAILNRAQKFWNGVTNTAVRQNMSSGGNLASGFKSQKFFIDGVTAKFKFNNAGNTLCNIEIYDCIAKTTQTTLQDPVTDWTVGLTDQDFTVSQSVTTPGAQPTEIKAFNIKWKILQKTRLSLHPGQFHTHTLSLKHNKILDTSYIEDYEQIRGITTQTFFKVQGIPVDKNASGSSFGQDPATGVNTVYPAEAAAAAIAATVANPTTTISLSATKLTGCVEYNYKIRAIQQYARGGYSGNEYQTAITGEYRVQNDTTDKPQILNYNNSAKPLDWA